MNMKVQTRIRYKFPVQTVTKQKEGKKRVTDCAGQRWFRLFGGQSYNGIAWQTVHVQVGTEVLCVFIGTVDANLQSSCRRWTDV